MMPKLALLAFRRWSLVTSSMSFLIDFRSRGGVDVMPLTECLYHVFITAEMSHDTQFYLTVVGREEQAALVRDERLSDFLSVLTSYGDVLQVGVA